MKLFKRLLVIFAMVAVSVLKVYAAQKQGVAMKSVIIYYSYSGNTAAAAMGVASVIGADVVQVEDVEKPGKFKAYIMGAFAARKEQAWPVKQLAIDLKGYDRVFIGAPVWWGKQAPEANAAIDQLALTGKQVVVFVTLGGNSSAGALEALTARVKAKGGIVVSSFAISTGGKSKEDIEAKAKDLAKRYQ